MKEINYHFHLDFMGRRRAGLRPSATSKQYKKWKQSTAIRVHHYSNAASTASAALTNLSRNTLRGRKTPMRAMFALESSSFPLLITQQLHQHHITTIIAIDGYNNKCTLDATAGRVGPIEKFPFQLNFTATCRILIASLFHDQQSNMFFFNRR